MFFFRHFLHGIATRRKGDVVEAGREVLHPAFDGGLVGAQHHQAEAIGDNFDPHGLALALIIFGHIGGIVQGDIHF